MPYFAVPPRAGGWIEIGTRAASSINRQLSHSARVGGLEFACIVKQIRAICPTPRGGELIISKNIPKRLDTLPFRHYNNASN